MVYRDGVRTAAGVLAAWVLVVGALAALGSCGPPDPRAAKASPTTAYNPRRAVGPPTTVDPSGGIPWSGRPAPPAEQRAPAARSSLGELTVVLGLPPAVVGGTVLHYVVALTNPTAHVVVFAGCPLYQEAIATRRALRAPSYILNCDGHRGVPAHGTLRFDMHLATPQVAVSQAASVTWVVLDPSDINAAGTITVLAGGPP